MNHMPFLFEPFAPLVGFSREMNRALAANGATIRSFVPAADVIVTQDDVTVTMDVPGLKVDDLSIELQGDTLTVRGERPVPYADGEDDGRTVLRLERGFGKFERVLRVPGGLDPDAITASMADGVLTLHIPVPEARKPRRIEIATGSAQLAREQARPTRPRRRASRPAPPLEHQRLNAAAAGGPGHGD
jgi:HSP20 family protein